MSVENEPRDVIAFVRNDRLDEEGFQWNVSKDLLSGDALRAVTCSHPR